MNYRELQDKMEFPDFREDKARRACLAMADHQGGKDYVD